MFRKILIPLDGSELAAKALTFLGPVLELSSAEVVLLGVQEQGADPTNDLEAREAQLGLTGCVRLVRQGDPAEQILTVARELGADLIAMSTHGRTGLSRFVRGSTAERVLRGAQVPILLTNPFTEEHTPIRRVLVPLDGSSRSASILPLVRRLASAWGAGVTLLRVELPLSAEHRRSDEKRAARERELREELAPQLRQLADAGVEATIEIGFAFSAAGAILEAAASGVDLVALTTHGRSGATRWLYGSVAEHVVHECRVPLLVKRIGE